MRKANLGEAGTQRLVTQGVAPKVRARQKREGSLFRNTGTPHTAGKKRSTLERNVFPQSMMRFLPSSPLLSTRREADGISRGAPEKGGPASGHFFFPHLTMVLDKQRGVIPSVL